MGSDREISFSGKPEVSTRGRSGERMRKLPRKSGRLVREVENRRQQAWEMEEAEERARIMLDATPLPAYLWGWDGELNLLECNQAILHLFGLNDKPEVAVRFFEMSPERQPDGMPSKEKALAFLHAAFETGYQTFEWMHCLPSGEPLPAKVTLRRIPWKNSWCIAAYVQDLREVKKQEQQAREAEERARIMLDATPLVCTLWDVDGNVIDCNQEAVNVLGLKDKAEYIEGFYNRAPEYQPNGQSSRSEVLRIARATLESGSQRFEWVSRTKSGELLPFESTTVRLPWKGSYRLASYARDLSASKLKEQQKREAEERSRILLDSTPIGATLWDSETTIFDCNQAMLRMFGFTDKAEFMRRFHDLNPEFQPDGTASRAKSLALMRAAFETGYQEFEWMHRTASREALPVAIILVRSPWKGGWCVAGYARDLREAKAHEQKMREADAYAKSLEVASQAAQVASQTKSEFLAKMSHELRTPLNAAIGFLGLELQKALPQETADNLETAQEACYSLLHLINDILDISKIEAGHFELSCDNYRLASFISEVVSLNSFRVSGESVVFRLEVDENLPSQLYGDDLRIKQVLNNLLSNAFKYTGKGAVTLRIEVEPGAKEQNGSLLIRFSVRDTGRGIAAKNLQNLFDSYARFDSMTNRRIEGTGLGLAISKNFVETMGGRIHVESTYRKGSVFSCIIPQRVVDPTPLGSATVRMLSLRDMRQKYGNERSRSWQCSYLPYARVLVVDDVPTNLGVAKGMLQRYGMSVDCVTSGQQAVKLMRSKQARRYSAIFMDHMMAGMDGVEALRRIRAIGTDHALSVPVIILTANVIAGNEKKFLDQGFQAFLGKPIDPSKLDAIINKWVKDARQEIREDAPRRRWSDVLLPFQADARDATTPAAGITHSVEGLDMQEAVSRFGSEETFFEVLRSYAVNTPQLLEQMRCLSKKETANPAEFAIMAHGIKGASYGVGAKALGDMAKGLERAATKKNWPHVQEKLPLFLEAAEKLLREISVLLRGHMPEAVPGRDKPLMPKPDARELAVLYKASLSCSPSAMEKQLSKLERYRYQSGGELVAWLRMRMDALDYDLISERLIEYSS